MKKSIFPVLLAACMMILMTSAALADYVARVNGTNYETLAAAIEAAKNNGTVTVLKDIVLTDAINITNGMNVTIEGEGKKITGATGKDVFYVENGKLTLTAGLNVYAPTDCVIYIRGGEVITSANLTKNGTKYSVIQGNGQYSGDVTIKGGLIKNEIDNKAAIYWPQDGKLTITDGKIIGGTALRLSSGELEITGGEFIANGDKQEYVPSDGGSVDDTGEAIMIENIGGNSGYEAIRSVSISGGVFKSTNADVIGSYDAERTDASDVEALESFISGGEFAREPSSKLIADKAVVAQVSDGSNKTYAIGKNSISDAIEKAAAKNASGTTVTVTKGDLNMSFPAGVVVVNQGDGKVAANGVSIAKGESYRIPHPAASDLPQTGDNSSLLFFAALLALSGAGLTLLKKRGMSR